MNIRKLLSPILPKYEGQPIPFNERPIRDELVARFGSKVSYEPNGKWFAPIEGRPDLRMRLCLTSETVVYGCLEKKKGGTWHEAKDIEGSTLDLRSVNFNKRGIGGGNGSLREKTGSMMMP